MAITSRNRYHHKNSESSAAIAKLNVYSRKYNFCPVTANMQAELYSVFRQKMHLGICICNGTAKEEAIGKVKALEFEKKKALLDTLTRIAWSGLLYTTGNLANQIARLVAMVVKTVIFNESGENMIKNPRPGHWI